VKIVFRQPVAHVNHTVILNLWSIFVQFSDRNPKFWRYQMLSEPTDGQFNQHFLIWWKSVGVPSILQTAVNYQNIWGAGARQNWGSHFGTNNYQIWHQLQNHYNQADFCNWCNILMIIGLILSVQNVTSQILVCSSFSKYFGNFINFISHAC